MSVLFYNQLREWSDASRRRNVARFVFARADADAHCNTAAASTTGLSSVARGMGRIVIDGGSALLQKQTQMQTFEDISESEDDGDGDGDDDGGDDGGEDDDDDGEKEKEEEEDEKEIERKIQMVASFLATNALHPDPDAEARRLYRLATHLQDTSDDDDDDDDEIQE